MLNPDDTVSADWLALYGEIISDSAVPAALKAYFLRIDEQPLDRAYAAWYQELVVAREKTDACCEQPLQGPIAETFRKPGSYSISERRSPKDGIEERMLKNVLLDLIAVDDSSESHALILDHFEAATTAADRVASLLALNRSSSPRRRAVLEEVYSKWHLHLSGYANYLRVVASGSREDVFEMIEAEKKRPGFDIAQPTWSRALFMPMAANNKMVWTMDGIRWVTATVIELAPINATTTGRLLNTFQHVRSLKPGLREKVRDALQYIVRNVSKDECPSVYGQAKAYLDGIEMEGSKT